MITNMENKPMLRPPLNFSKPLGGRFLKTRQNSEENITVTSTTHKKEEIEHTLNSDSSLNKLGSSTTLSRSLRNKTGLPPPSAAFKGTKSSESVEGTSALESLSNSSEVSKVVTVDNKLNDPFFNIYSGGHAKSGPLSSKNEISQKSSVPHRNKVSTSPSKTALAIDKMKQEREERRKRIAEARAYKQQQQGEYFEVARCVEMINEIRSELATRATATRRKSIGEYGISKNVSIQVCVRKRPLSSKESGSYAFDIATAIPSKHRNTLSRVYIHEPKSRLDLTKSIETHWFDFDEVFDENSSNMQIYRAVGKPLVEKLFEGGNSTMFAYGQTGSGKTHTIFGSSDGQNVGVYEYVCRDLFRMKDNHQGGIMSITMSFFEIYGGKVFDLLNDKASVSILEDATGSIQMTGLQETSVASLDEMLKCIEHGNQSRTTASTEANATSSRSHAIFQIALSNSTSSSIGKFSLIDLAGSERASESGITTKQSQFEGAEINKSLLALKECIRALSIHGDSGNGYVPFRASKLTQVLRDALTGPRSNTVVIANISPNSSSCEHTLNTLRYAGRVKDLKGGSLTNALTKKSALILRNNVNLGTSSSVDEEHENDTDEDHTTFSGGNTDSDDFVSTKEDAFMAPNFENVNNTPLSLEVFRHRLALQKAGPTNVERSKRNESNSGQHATNESFSVNPMASSAYAEDATFSGISLPVSLSKGAYTSQEQIRETNMEKGNKLFQENPRELARGGVPLLSKSSRILRNVSNNNNNISISPSIANSGYKLQAPTKTIDTNPLTPPPPFDPPTLSGPIESTKISPGESTELQESLDRLIKQQIYAIENVDRLSDQEKRMLLTVNQLETTAIVEYPGKLEEILTEKIAVLAALKELVLEFKQKSRQVVAWEKLKTLE